jgi:hypothetical protein
MLLRKIVVRTHINIWFGNIVVIAGHVAYLGLQQLGGTGGPAAGALYPLRNLQQLLWLDVSVGQQMGLQVGALVEAALAYGTSVRALLHVEDLVDGQGAGLAEALPAVVTLEGLLLGVNVSVVPQVVLSPKGLATNVTGIRSLISVGSLMDEQVVGLSELPVAELADEAFLWAG